MLLCQVKKVKPYHREKTKLNCDSRPLLGSGVGVENLIASKMHDQLTVPQDLDEPHESQQDIINIIEREIEPKSRVEVSTAVMF